MIHVQLPYGVGQHNITITNNGATSTNKAVTLTDRSPGIFAYNTTQADGTLQFANLAAAQLEDYSTHAATNPVKLGTNSLTLYVDGLGKPIDGAAPTLGVPAPSDKLLHVAPVDVYVNGNVLPASSTLFAGYAPTLIIHQVNVALPNNLPAGANRLKVCAGATCSPEVTVFMTNTAEYIAGNVRSPGVMSDGINRPLDSIAGTATSELGTQNLNINKDGNFLAPARRSTAIALPANSNWESYKDTVTASGATVVPSIPGFPHIVYGDAQGDYNRATRTWTNTGYFDPVFQAWRGSKSGGQVSLLNMVDYLGTTSVDPLGVSCTEKTMMWNRANFPIKVYLNVSNQPYYDPVTTALIQGAPPANAIAGSDLVWRQLLASPSVGGPTFERINYDPVVAGEAGVSFKFDTLSNLQGFGGFTNAHPFDSGPYCGPITSANVRIAMNAGTSDTLQALTRHEFLGRATGYGAALNGALSPFLYDNMGQGSSVFDNARDIDGRNMSLHLGAGFDLGKVAK
jgi:uncharacterized protein (TIGR03437 family)